MQSRSFHRALPLPLRCIVLAERTLFSRAGRAMLILAHLPYCRNGCANVPFAGGRDRSPSAGGPGCHRRRRVAVQRTTVWLRKIVLTQRSSTRRSTIVRISWLGAWELSAEASGARASGGIERPLALFPYRSVSIVRSRGAVSRHGDVLAGDSSTLPMDARLDPNSRLVVARSLLPPHEGSYADANATALESVRFGGRTSKEFVACLCAESRCSR